MNRFAVVLALAFLTIAMPASADSISLAVGSGQDVRIWTTPAGADNAPWAGSLVLTVNSGAAAGSTLLAYCVDLYNGAGWTEEVTITSTDFLPSAGIPPNVDPGAGAKVAYLYQRNQLGKTLTPTESAALQVAIWETLYDTGSPDLASGSFGLLSGGLVRTFAQGYLNDLVANNGSAQGLLFLSVNGKQQSLIAMVPEPASLLLLGSGLVSLGAWTRRRSRAKQQR